MDRTALNRFMARNQPDLSAVTEGRLGHPQLTPFWPFKLAGLLIWGETPGIRKLPGRLILAPMPVLCKICPTKREDIKEHLENAVTLGLIEAVEFYSNHALITIKPTAWETGALDVIDFGRDDGPDRA